MNIQSKLLRRVLLLIKELKKFDSSIAFIGGKIADDRIKSFEERFDIILPYDYKTLMKRHNGFSIMGDTVYPISNDDNEESLNKVYIREHELVKSPQPNYILPFSPDGGGNFYCFDTRYQTQDGFSNPVIFWVSNYRYTAQDQPEIVYNSFIEFVQEVIIDWTLEKYNHNGDEL